MKNFDTNDWGTWYDITVPAPDTDLVIDWGTMMANNTRRLTRVFAKTGTATGPMGTVGIGTTVTNFSIPPFVKYYRMGYNTGQGWTDYEFVGSGNYLKNNPEALETTVILSTFSELTGTMYLGSLGIGAIPIAWVFMSYGS